MQGFRIDIRAVDAEDHQWPPEDCDLFAVLSPTDPFVVDGITYDYRHSGCNSRLMIELFEDDDVTGVRLRADHPLTDDEIDQWMRRGRWTYRSLAT